MCVYDVCMMFVSVVVCVCMCLGVYACVCVCSSVYSAVGSNLYLCVWMCVYDV